MTDPDRAITHGLFTGLSESQVHAVLQIAHDIWFTDGQTILQEGREARGCWLVHEGQIALTVGVPDASPVVLQTLGPGDVLGWSWLTGPRRWTLSATARGPVEALEIDTDRLRDLAYEDPALGYALTRNLLDAALSRMQHTRARLLDVYRSPRER
jgi:CRP/FNR family transcriptional regulator, cyclic AMP receptor protein